MSAFTRSEIHVPDGFTLLEFDSTGEEGVTEVSIPVFDTTSAIAVLLEGDGADVKVQLGAEGFVDSLGGGPRLVVRKITGTRTPSLFLRATARLGASFKVSVLVVQRLLRKAWKRLSCPACKSFVRFLLSALLAGLGVPDIPLDSVVPEEAWARLIAFLQSPPDSVPQVIKDLLEQFEPTFLGRLFDALRQLNVIGRLLTAVSSRICEALGLCRTVH